MTKIARRYPQHNIGLYRDDGLGVFNESPQKVEKIKKDLCSIFRKYGLKITVEANIKTADYLDITLNLTTEEYYPYMKAGNAPLYVHSKSNHPPTILKNLPESVNKRLSELSSNENVFDRSKPVYQQALNDAGYKHNLTYTKPTSSKPRNRQRKNILWFNPPFSKSVTTNLGKSFLDLVKKNFPVNSKLSKIFNRNTLKLSYSTMDSIAQNIGSHNKALLTERNNDEAAKCNCRNKATCPVPDQCTAKCVIYQATVTSNGTSETYVGSTFNSFKSRLNDYHTSFKYPQYRKKTKLSKHVWELQDADKAYTITWKFLTGKAV